MTLRCPDTRARETRDGARMKTRTLLLLSVVSLFACSSPEDANAPPPPVETRSTPSALEAAHEAYLRSDWLTMTDRIHDVLLDRSSTGLVKENAFELLDKGYEATQGNLPSRTTLPAGMRVVTLGSMRGQHAYATYRTIYLYVKLDRGLGTHVKDISVRTQPGDVPVLDRAAGIGDVRLTPQPGEDVDEVVLEAKDVPSALPDGVATIRVSLDDGRQLDSWIIARGMASSASPEIATPTQSATFADPSPTFQWTPFRSPEYAPFEYRVLSVYVENEQTKKVAFDHWTMLHGDLASIKVDKKLDPGSYWLALTAGEDRKFGPINLARTSQRGVPFSVVVP
jgi:hypothetical protein